MKEAGLTGRYSGHSFRVGTAQSLAQTGGNSCTDADRLAVGDIQNAGRVLPERVGGAERNCNAPVQG